MRALGTWSPLRVVQVMHVSFCAKSLERLGSAGAQVMAYDRPFTRLNLAKLWQEPAPVVRK